MCPQAQYVVVITAFKDHLQQHVYTDITEAMMSCWELEQALSNFTGNLKRIVFYRIQVAQEHVSTMIDCCGQAAKFTGRVDLSQTSLQNDTCKSDC